MGSLVSCGCLPCCPSSQIIGSDRYLVQKADEEKKATIIKAQGTTKEAELIGNAMWDQLQQPVISPNIVTMQKGANFLQRNEGAVDSNAKTKN